MSRANYCELLQNDEPAVRSAGMSRNPKDLARRPIFHPEIGAFLKSARGKRAIKTVVLQAASKGAVVTENQIRWLEAGKTQHPDQAVLRALCDVYGLDYQPLAWRFVERNYELSPDYEAVPMTLPLDPVVEQVVAALEHARGVGRTRVSALLRGLALALDTDR